MCVPALQEVTRQLRDELHACCDAADTTENEQSDRGLCDLADATARLICRLPPEQQATSAMQACQPAAEALGRSLSGTGAILTTHAVPSLHVLAHMFQGLSALARAQEQSRIAYVQLVESHWDLLRAVVDCTLPESIVAALCAVLQHVGLTHVCVLPQVVGTLRRAFAKSGHAACLDALAQAAEQVGADATVSDVDAAPLFDAVGEVVGIVESAGGAGSAAASPDTQTALLSMLSRFVIFYPKQMLAAPALSRALALAVRALSAAERPVVQAALQLLQHTLAPSARQRRRYQELHIDMAPAMQLVAEHIGALVRQLLVCLCGSCPQESWSAVGRVLYGVMSAHGAVAVEAFRSALLDGQLEALAATPLTADDCARVAHIATARIDLPERRFLALVHDFAGIAHGMNNSADLLAYELPARRQVHEVVTLD